MNQTKTKQNLAHKTIGVTVSLTPDLLAAVDTLAASEGELSRSVILRRIIRDHIAIKRQIMNQQST